jgi:hypothetical protein
LPPGAGLSLGESIPGLGEALLRATGLSAGWVEPREHHRTLGVPAADSDLDVGVSLEAVDKSLEALGAELTECDSHLIDGS